MWLRRFLLIADKEEPSGGRKVEAVLYDESSLTDMRNLGAIHGYYGLPAERGLQQIDEEFARLPSPDPHRDDGAKQAKADEALAQTKAADEVLRRYANERLEQIRPAIVERLQMADRQTHFLLGRLSTPGAARFLVWMGGLVVTSQALMLGTLLEPLLRSAVAPGRNTPAPIQDVITLFVVSFSRLHDELVTTFPYMADHDWPWVGLGIVLLLSALLIHLRSQDSRGRLDLAELLQVNPNILPDVPGPNRLSEMNLPSHARRENRRAQLSRAITYVLFLTGTSMLLSTGRSEFMIAATILGTAITFVTTGLELMAVHSYLGRRGEADQSLAPSRFEILCVTLPAAGLIVLLIPYALLSQDTGTLRAVAYGVITFLLFGGGMMFGVGWATLQAHRNWRYWNTAMNELVARVAYNLQPPTLPIEPDAQDKPDPSNAREERKRRATVAYHRGYELGALARKLHPPATSELEPVAAPTVG